MSSAPNSTSHSGSAEKAFREAFERLKKKKPDRLSNRVAISQNNVAREAGHDPSALRKSRFPTLIAEIQSYIVDNPQNSPPSPRQALLAQRRRTLSLKDKIELLTVQRDQALSLLVEADAKIFELMLENGELRAKFPNQKVTHLRERQ